MSIPLRSVVTTNSYITSSRRKFFNRISLLHSRYLESNIDTSNQLSSGSTSCKLSNKRYYSSTRNTKNIMPKNMKELLAQFINDDTLTPYEKLVKQLYLTNLFRPMKLDLEIITQLATYLNIPLDVPNKIIHVAGSNGKGSCCLKIQKALQYSGYKVGLFTSPHISSFRERIVINDTPISEEDIVQLLPKIFEICTTYNLQATFFEITTALALLHFFTHHNNNSVDYIVLETGLGGRLDATNIFQRPLLSVITTISLEHTAVLGNTLELIAKEKAGIMKANCPILVGENVPKDVMRACAATKGSVYYTCNDIVATTTNDYDEYNSVLSKAALILLSKTTIQNLSPSSIEKGIRHRPSCRFELVTTNSNQVILDIAHNPQAIQNLLTKLKQSYKDSKVRFICGFSNDKDIKYCLSLLLEYDGAVGMHLVQGASGRAATINELVGLIDENDDKLCYDLNDPSVTKQVRNAMNISKDEVIVICGSAFLMGEAREALGVQEARDSDILVQVYGNNNNLKFMQDNLGSPQDRKS